MSDPIKSLPIDSKSVVDQTDKELVKSLFGELQSETSEEVNELTLTEKIMISVFSGIIFIVLTTKIFTSTLSGTISNPMVISAIQAVLMILLVFAFLYFRH